MHILNTRVVKYTCLKAVIVRSFRIPSRSKLQINAQFNYRYCIENQLNCNMANSKYPAMNWAAHDVADTFKLFKQRLLLVCEDNEVTNNEKIARKIKIGLGDEGLRRLNASGRYSRHN